MLNKNKVSTYLLYAIGEIVLVVVGILIAVSIDEWQKDQSLKKEERQYLSGIISNLEEDINLCQYVKRQNSVKAESITTVLNGFALDDEEEIYNAMIPHLDKLFSFEILSQNRVVFDNMTNAQSIRIIRDDSLSSELSKYYSYSFISEEKTAQLTRELSSELTPLIMNENLVNLMFNVELNIAQPKDEIPYYKNPKIISMMVNVLKNMEYQNFYADTQEKDARNLKASIESYLAQAQ